MKTLTLAAVLAMDAAAVGFAAYVIYYAIRHPGKSSPLEAWVRASVSKGRMLDEFDNLLIIEAQRKKKS
ncbi:MAG TPA: hypothetical protein VFE08_14515 [Candidatus Sulfotelmatobacter sp.]|jgi:hypothetical protein|nr:hypothetical protein [Candidatus Sulfotelmatobacter sp.]